MDAMDKIWENVVTKKFYITGGIGATHSGEAFGPVGCSVFGVLILIADISGVIKGGILARDCPGRDKVAILFWCLFPAIRPEC